jgi:hypothetical protein
MTLFLAAIVVLAAGLLGTSGKNASPEKRAKDIE